MLRSGNPVLKASVFEDAIALSGEGTMTIQGTVNKTLLAFVILLVTASMVWSAFYSGGAAVVLPMLGFGLIGGIGLAIATMIRPTWAPFSVPAYAACQGLALGGISAMIEMRYPGIVFTAVALTFGVLFSMLMAYKLKLLQATEAFKKGVISATMGIVLVYVASWIFSMLGMPLTLIQGGGFIGVMFSLFVVGVASLQLVMDFDFIENGAASGVPKHMEWIGAFGLMVSLLWLYFEILRLLQKLRSRE